jgi:hypothetical protein
MSSTFCSNNAHARGCAKCVTDTALRGPPRQQLGHNHLADVIDLLTVLRRVAEKLNPDGNQHCPAAEAPAIGTHDVNAQLLRMLPTLAVIMTSPVGMAVG